MNFTRTIAALACVLGLIVCAGGVKAEGASEQGAPMVLENGDQRITLAAASRHDNLAIFALVTSRGTDTNPYRPLDRAMSRGGLQVTELGSASVPTLKVKNTGEDKVFIMTGEIVTGAKQDRMSAHDVLLPPNRKAMMLPVYCVEQGRWVQTSQRFSAGRTAGTTLLRKTAAKKAGQGTIWSKVAKKSGEASVRSATGTLQAVYDNPEVRRRIAAFEKTLAAVSEARDVVGFVAAIDGNVVSADLFANHQLMAALWTKLLKAIAIDAVTSESPVNEAPSVDAVQKFLAAGVKGKRNKTENPGVGEEFLIDAGNDVSGTVLVYDDHIVHLSVFGPDREDHPRALAPVGNASMGSRSTRSEPRHQGKNRWSGPAEIGNSGDSDETQAIESAGSRLRKSAPARKRPKDKPSMKKRGSKAVSMKKSERKAAPMKKTGSARPAKGPRAKKRSSSSESQW